MRSSGFYVFNLLLVNNPLDRKDFALSHERFQFGKDHFVRHALTSKRPRKIVMLMRLAFLESERRSDILDGGKLARVLVFRNRLPMMHRAGWEGPKATSATAYAWFVWDTQHLGPTTIKRIS